MTSTLVRHALRLAIPAAAGLLGQAFAPEPESPRAPFLPPLGATPAPFLLADAQRGWDAVAAEIERRQPALAHRLATRAARLGIDVAPTRRRSR